jgi:hypothetical protein
MLAEMNDATEVTKGVHGSRDQSSVSTLLGRSCQSRKKIAEIESRQEVDLDEM